MAADGLYTEMLNAQAKWYEREEGAAAVTA